MDAWDSELRFRRRRISFIWDLISEREDSVYSGKGNVSHGGGE